MTHTQIINAIRSRMLSSKRIFKTSGVIPYQKVIGAGCDVIDDEGNKYRISVVRVQ